VSVHILNRYRTVFDRRTGALVRYGRIGVGGVRLQASDADTERHSDLRIVVVPRAVKLLVDKDISLGGGGDLAPASCRCPGQNDRGCERHDNVCQRPPQRPEHEPTLAQLSSGPGPPARHATPSSSGSPRRSGPQAAVRRELALIYNLKESAVEPGPTEALGGPPAGRMRVPYRTPSAWAGAHTDHHIVVVFE
jgi:hypothetical protein